MPIIRPPGAEFFCDARRSPAFREAPQPSWYHGPGYNDWHAAERNSFEDQCHATFRLTQPFIEGAWRAPEDVARDRDRHPAQTLFVIQQIRNEGPVIELEPGDGWYTKLLAPYLNIHSQYLPATPFVAAVEKPSGGHEATPDEQSLHSLFASDPDLYGHPSILPFDPKAPDLGAPGSAAVVLSFLRVHDWVAQDRQATMFRAIFQVLEPGGELAIVDNRAARGPATDGRRGYVTEQQVIDAAKAAGFVLDARFEINANPRDTRDYPDGARSLPPTLSQKDMQRAKYLAIGEPDRMTLRFVKPRPNGE